ncbi:energy transducer TonB, partial [bacterium]|nr:energy transducer TonB [bacterium]
IHFTVERDGRVTRETVERSSGVSLFDQEALNAVRRVGRMPPLPAGITGQNLGVHFTFTLETGP